MKKLQLIKEVIKESVKVGSEKYKTLHQQNEVIELAANKNKLEQEMTEITTLGDSISITSEQLGGYRKVQAENQLKKAKYEASLHIKELREDILKSLRFIDKEIAFSTNRIEELSNILKESTDEINKRKEELYKECKKHDKRWERIKDSNIAENFEISGFLKADKIKAIKSIKNEITIEQAIDNLVTVIFELHNNFSAQTLIKNNDFKVYSVGDKVECLYRENFILHIDSSTDMLYLASFENKTHKLLSKGKSLAELLQNNPQVDEQIILDIYKLALYTKNALEEELHKSA